MDLFSWLRREEALRDHARGTQRDPAGGATPGTEASDQAATVPTPVTLDRLRRWCEGRGYSYFIDSEGDLGGLWRGRMFFFFLLGPDREVLQVRGHWNREFAIERLPEALELCNAWHVERIWPTCYARVRDNGRVHVSSEVTADVAHGATDAQLDLLLQCGLGTATVFFDELDNAYPDPAGLAP